MKKLLTILSLIVFTGSVFATTTTTGTASSRLDSYVSNKLAPVAQKEANVRNKVENLKKADADKKAEIQKKQADTKAKIDQAKADNQAKQQAVKNAVQNEKNAWKNLAK